MSEVKVIIRTADQTRKAEVVLDSSNTGADVIQASVDNWSLPVDTDYSLVSTNSGKTLAPTSTLSNAEIKDGDILEVQPVLVAG
jgi:NMD protein affecting ribosome stability and mRNA decay